FRHLTAMLNRPRRRSPSRASRPWLVAAFLWAMGPTVNAYEIQLTPSQIREAWTLGQRNDQATAEFLIPYAKQSTPGTAYDPHNAEIEMLTPFAQVVDRSKEHSGGNYSEQQAIQDYKDHGNTVVVRVRLMLPSAFPKQESGPASAPPPTP